MMNQNKKRPQKGRRKEEIDGAREEEDDKEECGEGEVKIHGLKRLERSGSEHYCDICGTSFETQEMLQLHVETFHAKYLSEMNDETTAVVLENSFESSLERSMERGKAKYSPTFEPMEEQTWNFNPRLQFRFYDEMVAGRERGITGVLDANACAVACLHAADLLLGQPGIFIDQTIVDAVMNSSQQYCRHQVYSSPGNDWIFDPLRSAPFEAFKNLDSVQLSKCEETLGLHVSDDDSKLKKILTTMSTVKVPRTGSRGICTIINCGLETVMVFGLGMQKPSILFDPSVRLNLGMEHGTAAFMRFESQKYLLHVLETIFFPVFSSKSFVSKGIQESQANLLRFFMFRFKDSDSPRDMEPLSSPFSIDGEISPIVNHDNAENGLFLLDHQAMSQEHSPPPSSSASLSGLRLGPTSPTLNDEDVFMTTVDGISLAPPPAPLDAVFRPSLSQVRIIDRWLVERAKKQVEASMGNLRSTLQPYTNAFGLSLVQSLSEAMWAVPPVRSHVLTTGLREGPSTLNGALKCLFVGIEQKLESKAAKFALQSLSRAIYSASPFAFHEYDVGMVIDSMLRAMSLRNLGLYGVMRQQNESRPDSRHQERAHSSGKATAKSCIADLFRIETTTRRSKEKEEIHTESFTLYIPGYRFLSSQSGSRKEDLLRHLLPISHEHSSLFWERNSMLLFLPECKTVQQGGLEDEVKSAVKSANVAWSNEMPKCELKGEPIPPRPFFFMLKSKSPVTLNNGSRRVILVSASQQTVHGLVSSSLPKNLGTDLSTRDFESFVGLESLKEFTRAWLAVFVLAARGDWFYQMQLQRLGLGLLNYFSSFFKRMQDCFLSEEGDRVNCSFEQKRIPARYISESNGRVHRGRWSSGQDVENLLLDFLHESLCKSCRTESDTQIDHFLTIDANLSLKLHLARYNRELSLLQEELELFVKKFKYLVQIQPFEYLQHAMSKSFRTEPHRLRSSTSSALRNDDSTTLLRHTPMLYALHFDWSLVSTSHVLAGRVSFNEVSQVLRIPCSSEIREFFSRLSRQIDLEKIYDRVNVSAPPSQKTRNVSFWQMVNELMLVANEPALFFESVRKVTQMLSSSASFIPPVTSTMLTEIRSALEDGLALFSKDIEWKPLLEREVFTLLEQIRYHTSLHSSHEAKYDLCTMIIARSEGLAIKYSVLSRQFGMGEKAGRLWYRLGARDVDENTPGLAWNELTEYLATTRGVPVVCFYKRHVQRELSRDEVLRGSEMQRLEAQFGHFDVPNISSNSSRHLLRSIVHPHSMDDEKAHVPDVSFTPSSPSSSLDPLRSPQARQANNNDHSHCHLS